MAANKIRVDIQFVNFGITGSLSWLDATEDCMAISGSQGFDEARGFMASTGMATFVFKNVDTDYTPADNRSDTSLLKLENGRRIRWRVTLPTHGKIMNIEWPTATSPFANKVGQTITDAGAVGSHWTFTVELRTLSNLKDNGVAAIFQTSSSDFTTIAGGRVDSQWRKYTFVYNQPVAMTALLVSLVNTSNSLQGAVIEMKNPSIVHSSAPSTNRFTNTTFASGIAGWAVTGATISIVDDYTIGFDGKIYSIEAMPFEYGGNFTKVSAVDWMETLDTTTSDYTEQRSKRADQLIGDLIAKIPKKYWLQTPPGFIAQRGRQTFDRAYNGYKKKETYFSTAIEAAVSSENGLFWIDRDGTYKFANNQYHVQRAARNGPDRPAWYLLKANPADGTTITLWGQAYRFKTVPAAAFDVAIGVNVLTTLTYLTHAINFDTTFWGTSFHTDTTQHTTANAEYIHYPALVLNDGATVYYLMNEASGTSATDTTGKGHTGTISGGPTFSVTGAINASGDTGMRFDGANDLISIPNIDLYLKSFTIEMWLKPAAAPPAIQDVFSNFKALVTDQAMYLRIYDDGRLQFDLFSDSIAASPGTITFGASDYYHVVVRRDQDLKTNTIWVNGVIVASGVTGHFDGTTPTTMYFGGFPTSGLYYKGDADDFSIYEGIALTSEQIAEHYCARYGAIKITRALNPNETAQLVINNGDGTPYELTADRSLARVVNSCTISWLPRSDTIANATLGEITSPIQIPPRTDATNIGNVKPGFTNVKDGRVGQQEVTISYHDDTGNTVGGTDIVDPVATTDYQVFEFIDPVNPGYEYTTQSQFFWISDVVKGASEYKCILNNNATGALHATKFQIRGKMVKTYDPLQEVATNDNSITYYQERKIERSLDLNNDQLFAKALAAYTVERYGTPFVEANKILFKHADYINNVYLLSLEIADTIFVAEAKSGLTGSLHMIVQTEYELNPQDQDYLNRISFTLERLDQNAYLRLQQPGYGVVNGVNRVYI